MKIYTSYYNNKSIPKNIKKIGIVRIPPKWIDIQNYNKLAPSYGLLKLEEVTQGKWAELFLTELSKLDPQEVLKDLEKLSEGKDIVLLCYEKPGEFCHRHIVADWLGMELGIKINEYVSQKINQLKFL